MLAINGSEMIFQLGLEEDFSCQKYVILEPVYHVSPPFELIKYIEAASNISFEAANKNVINILAMYF